ncbi:MAG: D-alanyl-D-alanine carboxypeptidase family protein [Spirochaetaceae bacterium]|nr:D-alanyl-D-alanine carboxypeptidase family protein [Spirochaetaceae bacterium]
MNRGLYLGLVVFCSVSFFACAKSNEAQVKNVDSKISVESKQETTLTLEQQKLQRVMGTLSQRTRDGIVNGDSLEFLADLNKVLDSDTHNLLTLVDKKHFLDQDYVPKDIVSLKPNDSYNLNRNDLSLRIPAEASLRQMAEAAKKDGLKLLVSSTFRSYDYQANLYARNVKQLGKEVADRESAPPGASQHQLGTAIDFGSIDDSFAETTQGKWIAANAPSFGWSLSYPDGFEDVTGYRWECWHYRYIGKEAVEFQKKWFSDVQQFMLEFIYAWKTVE